MSRLTALLLLSVIRTSAAADVWPLSHWQTATPEKAGMDAARLSEARDYALTGGGSGYVIRGGKLVLAWGDPAKLYDLKSSTKAIGVTALGLAIKDGKLRLDDKASKLHPDFGVPPESNRDTGWLGEITLQHLATQTAGFEKPGGYGKLLFRPGTRWFYSDAGPNWLAECITLVYKRDVKELLFERVFTPIGITDKDLTWRKNAYRPALIADVPRREFGSGISANVNAMARIGYLYLHGGQWDGKDLLPRQFVDKVRAPVAAVVGLPEHEGDPHGNASDHYGLLWWNNGDGAIPGVPRDAYWSWGLYDSLIVVIPSLDIVVARAGASWKRTDKDHYHVLRPFLQPIVAAVQTASTDSAAPYPPSRSIVGVNWAPASSITRQAHGSDNWPMTWGDDDHQYTAYGDGRGFEPFMPRKLSLGLARIEGTPAKFTGINIPSPTGEQIGDGARGKKASGMLMVDGVLYMLARNAGNSQLAWSTDRGENWFWAEWKFNASFGRPTFLNFGKNYAGARDDYVYIYSHNDASAYKPADSLVLARVPKSKIRERTAYEFFFRLRNDQPEWRKDLDQRRAVFESARQCYRSTISYNAGLKRYLLCQVLPGKDPRFRGGLAIFDAPEPWGPWTTVYHRRDWDVGPGETASLPTKWMSADGREVHLTFSGDDCFSVRQATLVIPQHR